MKQELNHNMGAQVIAHLEKKFGKLPELRAGFIGGQAVASAVSELYGDGSGVAYNDLDIFRPNLHDDEFFRRDDVSTRRQFVALGTDFDSPTVEHDCYGSLVFSSSSAYSVTSTSRIGDVNFIDCWLLQSTADDANNHGVAKAIESFDINGCQVGVNLANGHLLWSPEFERFTRTKKLAITNLRTPAASLIRYFRKRQQLDGLIGSDERMLEMVALAWQVREHFSLGTSCWQFGRDFEKKLLEVGSDILPHFELVKQESLSFKVDDYARTSDVLVNSFKPRFEVPGCQFNTAIKLGTYTSEMLVPKISYAYGEQHDTATREKILGVIGVEGNPSPFFMDWAQNGDSVLSADVTREELLEINSLTQRVNLRNFLDVSMAESVRRLNWLKPQVAHYGYWIYEVIGTTIRSELRMDLAADEVIQNLFDGWVRHPKHFDLKAQEFIKNNSERLIKPLFEHEVKFGDYNLVELTTKLELWAVGEHLNKYLGNETYSMARGTTRVFALKKQDNSNVLVAVARENYWLRQNPKPKWSVTYHGSNGAGLDVDTITDLLAKRSSYALTAKTAPKALKMLMLNEATPYSIQVYAETVANRINWTQIQVRHSRAITGSQVYGKACDDFLDEIPF